VDILVDSSIIIASERGQIDLDNVLEHHATDFVALSAITVAELQYGVLKRPLRSRAAAQTFVSRLLAQFPIVPFDAAAAHVHASVRLALEKSGAALGHNDLLIASTAIAHNMAIAARDRDFARVQELAILHW
jgi:predicted nucleic acid-binding protein